MRQQIEAISESACEVRYLLGTVLDVLDRAKSTDVVGAVGLLLAYGAYLDSKNQHRLGQHVLNIAIETLDSPDAGNGLRAPCRLMVDKITTVPKSKVGGRVGRLDDEDVLRLNQAVLVFLGLAASPRMKRET